MTGEIPSPGTYASLKRAYTCLKIAEYFSLIVSVLIFLRLVVITFLAPNELFSGFNLLSGLVGVLNALSSQYTQSVRNSVLRSEFKVAEVKCLILAVATLFFNVISGAILLGAYSNIKSVRLAWEGLGSRGPYVCPSCGAELRGYENFCPSCGFNLRAYTASLRKPLYFRVEQAEEGCEHCIFYIEPIKYCLKLERRVDPQNPPCGNPPKKVLISRPVLGAERRRGRGLARTVSSILALALMAELLLIPWAVIHYPSSPVAYTPYNYATSAVSKKPGPTIGSLLDLAQRSPDKWRMAALQLSLHLMLLCMAVFFALLSAAFPSRALPVLGAASLVLSYVAMASFAASLSSALGVDCSYPLPAALCVAMASLSLVVAAAVQE